MNILETTELFAVNGKFVHYLCWQDHLKNRAKDTRSCSSRGVTGAPAQGAEVWQCSSHGRRKTEERRGEENYKEKALDPLCGFSVSGQRRPSTGPYFLRMPVTPTSITAEMKLTLTGETSESKLQHLGLIFTKRFFLYLWALMDDTSDSVLIGGAIWLVVWEYHDTHCCFQVNEVLAGPPSHCMLRAPWAAAAAVQSTLWRRDYHNEQVSLATLRIYSVTSKSTYDLNHHKFCHWCVLSILTLPQSSTWQCLTWNSALRDVQGTKEPVHTTVTSTNNQRVEQIYRTCREAL